MDSYVSLNKKQWGSQKNNSLKNLKFQMIGKDVGQDTNQSSWPEKWAEAGKSILGKLMKNTFSSVNGKIWMERCLMWRGFQDCFYENSHTNLVILIPMASIIDGKNKPWWVLV